MNTIVRLLMSLLLIGLAGCTNRVDPTDEVAALYSNTTIFSNIVYSTIDSTNLLLDVYAPTKRFGAPPWIEFTADRKPTLLFFHGGGFNSGDKISRSLMLMPFVSKGWCVVTADYRLIDKTTLKGMIGDARAALNWVYDNADKYKFDTNKIVVSGESAGGHLALMTAFLRSDTAFETPHRIINRPLRVAAVVNWFGVPDLTLAAKGWNASQLQPLLGKTNNPDSLLRLYSPIHYVNATSPPVFTIHGDQDQAANYAQAPLLRDSLNKYSVTNYLYTVKGKKHGNFDPSDMTEIYKALWPFLQGIGLSTDPNAVIH
jgi:acetyl esterase/lipase